MDPAAGALAADRPGRPAGAVRTTAADAAVAAAIVAGLLIRVFAARGKILWFDEFLGGNLVRRPWSTLLPAIRREAHPPLYYAALKIWTAWFGDGPLGMKSLSVVAGTGAIAFAAAVVRRTLGAAAAAAAAVLIAFSTVQIDQGSEAKPYGVLAFFVALLLWAVVDDRRAGTRGSLAVLLAVGIGCASVHFYGGVAAGGIACAAIVAGRPTDRRRAALLLGVVVAVSAVWLAGAFRLDRGAADYIREMWGRVPTWAPFAASTRVALPGWRKPYPSMNGRILPYLAPREIVAAAIVLAIAVVGILRGRSAPEDRSAGRASLVDRRFLALAALALWPGFLAVEVALAAVDRPVALVGRSEVVAQIGFAVLVAFAVARWKPPAAAVGALAAVALWTVLPQWWPRSGPQGHRWEEVIVRRLQAVVPRGTHVDIVTLGLGRPPFDYYADGDPRLRLISFPESQNTHPGWAAHSVSSADRESLALEAERLVGYLDAELRRGVPVYLVGRDDPRNAWFLSALRRDHEIRPVPWGAGWFKEIVLPPILSAALREPFSASGVRRGEGGPTCDAEFEPVFSFFSSERPRRRSMPPPTAGSPSRFWSAATLGASTTRGARSTSRPSAASLTTCA